MLRRVLLPMLMLVAALVVPPAARSDTLSIHQLQVSTAEDGWRSAYENEVVSIRGGVVTHKAGFRIVLQDPSLGPAWAGVEIRAWQNTAPLGAVAVGDEVDFFDVFVEEFVGGTIPQFTDSSRFEILSTGNPLPEPVVVPLSDLANPPDRERCEKYEAMLVAVEDVRVGRMDLGKAEDNYQLFSDAGTMWASDYYNLDLQVPPFPTYYVRRGERYGRVVGVFQEYSRPDQGWDYYQLLPRGTGDYERSSFYTIRDVQESSEADDWGSVLQGARVRVGGVVSSERSGEGLLSLADPLLGNEWAGVFVLDVEGALADLVVGDEVDLDGVLVEERDGVTVVTFDAGSALAVSGSGREPGETIVPPDRLRRSGGPEVSERYEAMRVSVYNSTVVQRGTPEGSHLYYLVAGSDTLLASDAANPILPADSTFFVREGDRLGRLRGIVTEIQAGGETCYVLEPRSVEDYWFLGGRQRLTSWGRMKRQFNGEES